MKKQLTFLAILAAVAAIFSCSAKAQTATITGPVAIATNTTPSMPDFPSSTNSPSGVAGVWKQIETWATTVDTNLNYAPNQFETGYKQITGVGASMYVAAQRNIGSFNIQGLAQFNGFGSKINAAEIGAGYAIYNNHDFKIEGNLLGGYDSPRSTFVVEPSLKATKMFNKYFYTSVEFSEPVYGRGKFNSGGEIWWSEGVTF